MTEPQYIFDSSIDNDIVDIYSEPKPKVKQITPDDPEEFRVRLEGKCIDNSISNAIRITILKRVPVYAFNRTNIYVENEKSKHMYNNDMLYLQIETLPIFDIPNYFDVEDPEIFLPTDTMKEIFGKFIQPKNVLIDDSENEPRNTTQEKKDPNKKLMEIEFSLNVKNITDTYKFVTTHDAVLKIDGKISKSYKKKEPISIIVLKPDEEISLRAEANLGVSVMTASYEATTNVVCKKITPSKYEIYYETLGQLNSAIIFQKACTILVTVLKNLHKYIKKKYTTEPDKSEYIKFDLYGIDHALGNMIATTLQKCEHILEAGYTKPHPFVESIVITYKLKPKAKIGPIQLFLDTLTYLIGLYENIKEQSLELK